MKTHAEQGVGIFIGQLNILLPIEKPSPALDNSIYARAMEGKVTLGITQR